LAYALKAFALSANGRLVPATVISNPAAINLRAYAVLAADNTVSVVLINKEYGPEGREAQLTVAPGTGYAGGQMMFLSSPGGDVQAKSGVTLGGAAINDDGSWAGTWTPLAAPSVGGRFSVNLPAATAVLLRWTRN
jgi:hypothetical protein